MQATVSGPASRTMLPPKVFICSHVLKQSTWYAVFDSSTGSPVID